MGKNSRTNDSMHKTEILKQGEFFLEQGVLCTKIGRVLDGVMRGYVLDNDGNEITTHFYQEESMVIGSFIPNTNTTMTISSLGRL